MPLCGQPVSRHNLNSECREHQLTDLKTLEYRLIEQLNWTVQEHTFAGLHNEKNCKNVQIELTRAARPYCILSFRLNSDRMLC